MNPESQSAMNSQPIIPSSTAPEPNHGQNHEKKVGPIIATLVIVLILIIAALYLFASRINQPAIPDDNSVAAGNLDGTVGTVATATAYVKPTTGTSTDVGSLQNDLNNATKGLDNQNF